MIFLARAMSRQLIRARGIAGHRADRHQIRAQEILRHGIHGFIDDRDLGIQFRLEQVPPAWLAWWARRPPVRGFRANAAHRSSCEH